MYDNIKIRFEYPFTDSELMEFCSRHNLEHIEGSGKYRSGTARNLKQGKGVFVKLDMQTAGKGTVRVECSLHKLYNEITTGNRQNWNDFDFGKAREAAEYLSGFVGLDISRADVVSYEIGINVQTTQPPEVYLRQLECIVVKFREIRIMEDPKYKEYKQFTTNKSKDKRIVYVFYDKTHEQRGKSGGGNVPDNILRIEMKCKRTDKGLKFCTLFDTDFQNEVLADFAFKIVDCLKYQSQQREPRKLTSLQFETYKAIRRHGVKRERETARQRYKAGKMSKDQYYYKLNVIGEVSKVKEDLEDIKAEGKELKQLISNKLEESRKNTDFCGLQIITKQYPIITYSQQKRQR